MVNDIFAKRIKKLRSEKQLSQLKFCKALGDMKQPVYARYEKGEMMPSFDNFVRIADFYNVSTDYLLGRTDNKFGKYFSEKALPKDENIRDFITMCFEPNTEANNKLKETLKKMLEEQDNG